MIERRTQRRKILNSIEKDTTIPQLYNYITRLYIYDNILYFIIDLHSYLNLVLYVLRKYDFSLDIESTIIISSIENWS